MEAKSTELHHVSCNPNGYLTGDYLTGAYLAPGLCGHLGAQVLAGLDTDTPVGFQVEAQILDFPNPLAAQAQRTIEFEDFTGFQVRGIQVENLGVQLRAVIYNTTKIRILCDFPSRGTSGTNWTASSTATSATNDFDVNNVNTDIVEQAWRSVTGTTSVNLDCDTELPQGVFLDTLAILNHNLTTSASITLQGSDNPTHSPVGESIVLTSRETDMYYIAPELPLTSYRYWRFVIDDPTNPDNFLQVGTIVFGNAIIFNEQCFTDRLVFRRKHFSDKLFTEGHTNVANDRGIKRAIELTFRNVTISSGEYLNLQSIYNTARTNLKCLWIPTPQYPERYAVFAKLADIPIESHNDRGEGADYVDFNVELDESL
jgi:hypothetical protein